MMGYQAMPQSKLFYIGIDLEKKVRKNHPLRKIDEIVDFDFIYSEVKESYGGNGNVSVPPTVILKLILLLVFYNVRSERELMETLPERLDWLWFLGYDLDTELPNHSVLSKARKRWGVEVFRGFFERIVFQCVKVGLVDGEKIFMDSSLIDADASNNSVVDTHSLKRHLNKRYRELERRLEEKDGDGDEEDTVGVNKRYVSTTDSEAAIVRHRTGKPKLSYKTHRAVDSAYEIITATEVTAGDINEAHRMASLIDAHHDNTGYQVETVVADSKYGTVDNFLECSERGINAHIPDLKAVLDKTKRNRDIYGQDKFIYDSETDTYVCPTGVRLKRRSFDKNKQSIDYSAPAKECSKCQLRSQCTRNKYSRSIMRHLRQEELDQMRARCQMAASKRDIKTRQHLMERSFARSKRYGYDRSRWRGLWRNQAQEYMTAAIQNIEAIIRYAKGPGKAVIAMFLIGGGMSVRPDLLGRLRSILLVKQKYLYWKEMTVSFTVSTLVWATAR
jgi:transposase